MVRGRSSRTRTERLSSFGAQTRNSTAPLFMTLAPNRSFHGEQVRSLDMVVSFVWSQHGDGEMRENFLQGKHDMAVAAFNSDGPTGKYVAIVSVTQLPAQHDAGIKPCLFA